MTEEINSEYLEEKLLSEEPEWSDLVPISQPEGLEPVVQILYNKVRKRTFVLLKKKNDFVLLWKEKRMLTCVCLVAIVLIVVVVIGILGCHGSPSCNHDEG